MTERSDIELLAVVIGGKDSIRRAAEILGDVHGVHGLARAGSATRRLTPRLRERIVAALELGRRSVDRPLDRGVQIRGAFDVFERLKGRLAPAEQEELHVLGLDPLHRLITHFVAAVGTLNQVYASPRDVFRPLVRECAHSAIVIHNHPSGAVAPSQGDAELTRRLLDAGDLVGIRVLDHIVIGREGYFSFAEKGRMDAGIASERAR